MLTRVRTRESLGAAMPALPTTFPTMYFLERAQQQFPEVTEADEDGLLAIGGDLSPERLLHSYRSGIFPWYSVEGIPFWYAPDPRFVLFPEELKISKSMQQVLRRGEFTFAINRSFEAVIRQCAGIVRKGADETWISHDFIAAYTRLHREGHALSAEAWQEGRLVGGLYGVLLPGIFCGESMFAEVSNASKFAFISLVQRLQTQGVQLIDCQVHTPHLESLGARNISRQQYMALLGSTLSGGS